MDISNNFQSGQSFDGWLESSPNPRRRAAPAGAADWSHGGPWIQTEARAVSKLSRRNVLKTSEIEGERLDADQVRSSIARRLGMTTARSTGG